MALLELCRQGLTLAEQLFEASRHAVVLQVTEGGKPHQLAAHGFAWQATYVEALRQALRWATALQDGGALSAVEAAILRLGFAEYLAQLAAASRSARRR
jgi:(2S)-methylsuccinyl-CoA dehydrogenase